MQSPRFVTNDFVRFTWPQTLLPGTQESEQASNVLGLYLRTAECAGSVAQSNRSCLKQRAECPEVCASVCLFTASNAATNCPGATANLCLFAKSKILCMPCCRDEACKMFYTGYNNYIEHAFPKVHKSLCCSCSLLVLSQCCIFSLLAWVLQDELRPISCTGHNSQGGIAVTLIDALSSLLVCLPMHELSTHPTTQQVAALYNVTNCILCCPRQ